MTVLKVCAVVSAFMFGATTAVAQDTMMAGLSAVLGQERASISEGAAGDYAVLANAASRNRAPDVDYSAAYLSQRPNPTGGSHWNCLSEALYFEARGETVRGMFAVAEVIMNRVDASNYPDTICAVINQGTGGRYQCQFSYTCDGLSEEIGNPAAWRQVGVVARLMMDGAPRALTGGATHYHTRAVAPSWSRVFVRTTAIDSHYFYRS